MLPKLIRRTITGDSLVPISLVLSGAISFGGSIYYIAQVSAMALDNQAAIVRVDRRSDYTAERLAEIAAQVRAVDAKLDLLIDIQHSESRPRKRRNP